MTFKNLCPILTTHQRLNHTLSVFDDINKSYQNPEKFTSDLNNLIQVLRNITFMLQVEKEKIKDFDNWYKPIQNTLKRDDIMKWLHDSRTHIVHRGDLEKESYLTIRIIDHFNQEIFTEKSDPFLTTEQAIKFFRKKIKLKFPEILKDDIVLEAERKWVVSTFPNAEIVDILIYCFSVLTNIVEAAHNIFNDSILTCVENNFFNKNEDFKIVLRNKLKKNRRTRVCYDDGKIITSQILSIEQTTIFKDYSEMKLKRKVEQKYGDISNLKKLMNSTDEEIPFCFLKFHLEISKRFLLTDGSILPICFFYFSKIEPPRILSFDLEDSFARFSMAESIADMAEETKCKAVLFISEVWIGDFPKKGDDYVPARLQKNKKEAVEIVAITPDKIKTIHLPFYRDNEKIVLGEELYDINQEWLFFNKLKNNWKNII